MNVAAIDSPGEGLPKTAFTGGRRRRLAPAAVACALVLAVAWSWLWLSSSRQAAADAAAGLSACRDSAARIERLRRGPIVAGSHDVQAGELSRRIVQAAADAGVPDGGLDRPETGAARQVGDTAYRETPTRVRLRGVTLPQLFAFLHTLASDEQAGPSLRVAALRLSAPGADDAGESWNAEATLTYLVYDPKGAMSN